MSSAASREAVLLPAAWAAASALVVRALDQELLPARLVEALATLGPFDRACVFVYRRGANPLPVYDTFASPEEKQGLLNYAHSTYVLNPFYVAWERGLAPGAHRMRDLAPDAYVPAELLESHKATPSGAEEIGYLTHGWPAGMEELCLGLQLPEGEGVEISLSRPIGGRGFADAAEVARFDAVIPFLTAAFERYWTLARTRHLAAAASDSGADAAFSGFGGALLSPREREIAQLLLRGHSGHSIGAQLGISATTVKTHRKNLYAKLGIATQFELFSLFLDSIKGGRRA